MKKIPEDSNELEDFYRKELGDLEIEPPADAWSAIQQRIPKPKKPFFKTSGFMVGSFAVLFTAVTLLLLTYKQEDSKALDKIQHEIHIPTLPNRDTVVKEIIRQDSLVHQQTHPKSKAKKIRTSPTESTMKVPSTNTSENNPSSVTETSVEATHPASSETQEPKQVMEKKTPKSFYEKYSEERSKDTSSNSLFKPKP
ncbi:MAG: hypothetical protein MUF42_12485 [Cytophagaceae bacterium]|jgi:hypothetical protein|nr:hypothetical protein [Cytophagaceae bacterium]